MFEIWTHQYECKRQHCIVGTDTSTSEPLCALGLVWCSLFLILGRYKTIIIRNERFPRICTYFWGGSLRVCRIWGNKNFSWLSEFVGIKLDSAESFYSSENCFKHFRTCEPNFRPQANFSIWENGWNFIWSKFISFISPVCFPGKP